MSEATAPIRGFRRGLPRPIGPHLAGSAGGFRLNSLLTGLGTTALVLAIGAAMGMAADFAWDLSSVRFAGGSGPRAWWWVALCSA